MEDLDIKHLIRKLLSKWYLFVTSLAIVILAALFYLSITAEKFLVATTIQLKDKARNTDAVTQEEFLSGVDFLGANSEVEDEIGILTSYSLIHETLKVTGQEIRYFEHPRLLGIPFASFSKEIYPAPFKIEPDSAGWQIIDSRIDISFIGTDRVRIQTKGAKKGCVLYNTKTNKTRYTAQQVAIDTVLSLSNVLKTPFLHFFISNVDPQVFYNDKEYSIIIRSVDRLAEQYGSRITTNPISANANIIKLSLNTIVPGRDIDFLESLCNVYIDSDLKKKNQLGERTIEFIDFQLQGVTDSLRHAESTLESFRYGSNIMDVNVTSQNLTNQLGALEDKQALLNVQNKYYKYIANYLAKNEDVTQIVAPSSVGIQDQLLNNVILQLTELNHEKISRSYNSKELNPALQVLEKKIRLTKDELNSSISNLIGTNEISLEENRQRIREIRSFIGRLPKNERSLTDIQRRFNFSDNIYNYLLQKRAEAGIAIASNVPDKRVIDAPRQMRKVGPNPLFILLLAIFAGLFLPAAFVFARDFLDPKLESIDQLATITALPIIERLAQVSNREKKNGWLNNGYLAHSFRYIRQQLIALKRSKNIKTIGITSAMSGEGKTFCSYNLGISLTGAGYKTILIDLDLQQPKLSKYFQVNIQPGITDYLKNNQPLIIQRTHINKLDIITAGSPVENPSDLLNHLNLEMFVSGLREKYDYIIFDTPPVGIIADYLTISKIIDYTIIVVRNDYSKKEAVRRIDKLMTDYALLGGILYNGTKAEFSYGAYNKYRYQTK